jgi:hypothetical protein
MSEMDRLQKKGELDEDVLRALEEDVTGKVRVLRSTVNPFTR